MIGVILCTHSTFANGLREAVQMIAGEQSYFETICFMNGDDPVMIGEVMSEKIRAFQEEEMEVCIVVDMFAATPFNVALRQAVEKGAFIVTGANLPLMLAILLSRESFEGDDVNVFLEGCLQDVKESMRVIDPTTLQ